MRKITLIILRFLLVFAVVLNSSQAVLAKNNFEIKTKLSATGDERTSLPVKDLQNVKVNSSEWTNIGPFGGKIGRAHV